MVICQPKHILVCFVSKKMPCEGWERRVSLLFRLLNVLVYIGGKLVVSLVESWLFNLFVIRELGEVWSGIGGKKPDRVRKRRMFHTMFHREDEPVSFYGKGGRAREFQEDGSKNQQCRFHAFPDPFPAVINRWYVGGVFPTMEGKPVSGEEGSMFTRLIMERFTVFERAEFLWSPGVNVMVGINGTGKTHVMKVMYALQMCGHDPEALGKKLATLFRPSGGDISRLIRKRKEAPERGASLSAFRGQEDEVHARFAPLTVKGVWKKELQPVYIPVKEMLSFAPGLVSLYDMYALPFEEMYYDILKQAYLPARKDMPLPDAQPLLDLISEAINGGIVVEGDAFFLKRGGENVEMGLVAEGHRKLALVWQLIRNGSLAQGSCLFWDEPETNLNPSLLQTVVQILMMLARRGVQVFTVTHNYAFLRELDFQREKTELRYFALEETEGKGVIPYPCDTYQDLSPNRIADEYRRLYDLEIMRSLGGV